MTISSAKGVKPLHHSLANPLTHLLVHLGFSFKSVDCAVRDDEAFQFGKLLVGALTALTMAFAWGLGFGVCPRDFLSLALLAYQWH
jgi:hypothetical protein